MFVYITINEVTLSTKAVGSVERVIMDDIKLRRSLNEFNLKVCAVKETFHSAFKHQGGLADVNEFTGDLQDAFKENVRGEVASLYVAASNMHRDLEGPLAKQVLNALREMEPLLDLAQLEKISVHPNAEKLEADLDDAAKLEL